MREHLHKGHRLNDPRCSDFRFYSRFVFRFILLLFRKYIYVGDVGELDQEAGETMLREYPEVVKAVFLHVVTDQPDGPPIIPAPKLINGRPVVFFRTYVGAAVDAVQLGLISLGGLRSVIAAASEKLVGVPETSDKWKDVRKDLERADILLETSDLP